MSVSVAGRSITIPRPTPITVATWLTVLVFQTVLVVTYAAASNAQIGLFHVYPFVWINLSLWVFWQTDIPTADRRQHALAGSIAIGYFAILGFFGGLYGWLPLFDHPEHHLQYFEQMQGFDLAVTLPPGYGPALFYVSPTLALSITPYALIGYLTLAYLVYVTVLDAANAAAPGILGLFACISCTWPIIASAFVGAGTSTTLVAGIYAQAYELSTIAFVLTVLLLYWRPLE
ncbi:hypothetical protein D8Y22_11190 [Salinadaptatus halalkaliphilus]|uniref:Uncharacterized protein n=1 Tax=Salinadaptatus halalkaliphilus TaxID=2419781 RepID=A0A4S3TKY8_9EURY|nr:hypothetical protein [Salinadaptatus halalkaliphilus]THE64814.1 hypothetical protein D8Y22_11190 [Salinadaptatus halalkaliphilus]